MLAKSALTLALFAFGCGANDDGSVHQPKPQAPDSTTFNVSWKPSTVQLAASDATGLASPTPDATGLHFNTPTSGVQGLKVGDIFVLPGVGLYRVTTVTPNGAKLDLGVQEASLIDAADSGDVTWDIGAHHMGDKKAVGVLGPADLPGPAPMAYTGQLGNYDTTLTITPNGDRTNIAATIKLAGSFGSILVTLSGWVEAFRAQGSFRWSAGSAQTFALSVRDYRAEFTVAYEFKGVQGEAKRKIPLSVTWPFLLGPIPMYIGVTTSFDFRSTLTTPDSAAKGSAKFVYDGTFGVSGPGFAPSANVSGPSFEIVNNEHASPITAGIGAVLEAPVVALGMGVASPRVFGGNVYFKLKNEVVSNLVIPNPLAAGKPSCLKVSCGVGAYFGGELNFFGVPVQLEKAIFEKSKTVAQTGSACN